jgi:hypothetical protein
VSSKNNKNSSNFKSIQSHFGLFGHSPRRTGSVEQIKNATAGRLIIEGDVKEMSI